METEISKPLLEAVHYYIIAIGGLASAVIYLFHHNHKTISKKDAVILRITEDYAKQNKDMAVESTKAFSGVQTSIENNTKVIERLLDRDENTSRRR